MPGLHRPVGVARARRVAHDGHTSLAILPPAARDGPAAMSSFLPSSAADRSGAVRRGGRAERATARPSTGAASPARRSGTDTVNRASRLRLRAQPAPTWHEQPGRRRPLLPARPGPARTCFRTQRRLAARHGSRRVPLTGDAAHGCGPVGGQGLDPGLRDAVSLAAVPPDATARGGPADEGLTRRRRARRADAAGVLVRRDLATRARALGSPPVRAVRDTVLRGVLATPVGRRLLAEAVTGPRRSRS
ncbi:FAD-dependent monooxygenase [Streptomyces sp. NPDC059015]|uniref:FAD-dependent monooxygenase n=2 Tax=Streptomyces TaxID=1883 RepID=UPI0036AB8997